MRKIILLVAFFLLFSGCITEGEKSLPKMESVYLEESFDFNEDGITDFYHYIFSEKTYGDYKIQREIYIFPSNELESISFKDPSDADMVDSLNIYQSFSEELKSNFDACSKVVGTLNLKCTQIENCALKCASSSSKCKLLVEKYPEFMGYLVYSLEKSTTDRKDLINSLNNNLWEYSSLSALEKRKVFENLNSLYELSVSTLNNPIYSNSEISLCYSSQSYDSYNSLLSSLGEISLKTSKYTYLVMLKVESTSDYTGTNYTDLFVTDSIPVNFDVNSITLIQNGVMQGKKVLWDPIRSDNKQEILFYTFESTELSDSSLWQTPEYQTRSIDLLPLLPTLMLFSVLLPITGYYISVSLSIVFPVILFIIIINLFLLLYSIIIARIQNKSFYRAIKNFAGVPNSGWKKDFIFGS
ncbi:MAG: hypothetical protein PHU63_03450, partial [Candidatus ainarchaeum sp.]|nr:hypothetical protein [Candidatus ainarchaeum sp.]